MSRSNIVFVLTGSIAAYKACDALSKLVQKGHRVRTVATRSALRFVGTATLEGLTGERVLTDLFEPGTAMEHIDLSRWADLILVCPCSANTLNRLAAGIADDLTGALLLAREPSKPLLLAPAMNPAMWAHPATRRSIETLSSWGVRLLPVGSGRTACGETGDGRMAEPEEVVAAVEAALSRPARRLRVLVTSGGTSVPIDGVRSITNLSTGHTGAVIAGHLAESGHEVTLLRARGSERPSGSMKQEEFVTFDDLDKALERLLPTGSFDAVVHAAAVSDFSVQGAGAAKLPSDGPIALRLTPNPKLIDTLRSRSGNPSLRIVGFKLTRGVDGRDEVRKLMEHSEADMVVHNDPSERADPDAFPSTLHFRDGREALHFHSRPELASAIENALASGAP